MFNGVAMLGPDNAWAVGRGKDAHALVEHWNGTAWTVAAVPAPSVPSGWTFASATLTGVSARSATDIWAVGSVTANRSGSTQTRPLALHYDGTSWAGTPTPANATVTVSTVLNAVTAVAANDVWSVGDISDTTGQTPVGGTLTMHWNGSVWSRVAGPNGASGSSLLTGVSASPGGGDVQAAGFDVLGPSACRTLVLRDTP